MTNSDFVSKVNNYNILGYDQEEIDNCEEIYGKPLGISNCPICNYLKLDDEFCRICGYDSFDKIKPNAKEIWNELIKKDPNYIYYVKFINKEHKRKMNKIKGKAYKK